MAYIELTRKTTLSAKAIKQKAEMLIRDALEDQQNTISDVQQEWRDDTLLFSFKAKGLLISGEAIAQDQWLTIKATLPFAATLFRRKIEDVFREKAEELFP